MKTLLGSASQLDRTMPCPASNQLPQIVGPSKKAITAAAEGTRKHSEVEKNPEPCHPGYYSEYREVKMVWHEDGTVDVLGSAGARQYGDPKETSVPGTSDVIIQGYRTAEIWDYKFGRWPVAAKGNRQLLHLGLMLDRVVGPFDTILLGIWQHGEEDKVQVCHDELLGFESLLRVSLAKALEAKQAIANGNEPPVRPGDWCKFCPAKPACPAFKDQK